jgi:hypothetical protein
LKKTGIVIFTIGLLITLYAGLNYFTRGKIMDSGEQKMTRDNLNIVSWSPYVGIGIMLIGGVVLVLGVNRNDEEGINGDLK